jgi:sugar phosphate isomerase/epimerase
MCRDIGHSRAVHEEDVPFLMDHRERLIHFHIHDGTETPPRNHLALGNGEIDLQARLQLAREAVEARQEEIEAFCRTITEEAETDEK